ncbi:gamma-glutamylcyclotransferase family protein [Planktotalea sp.]|uniref:gamma-glutamylcyclotransferase family protein n=1 Tax=Planktotalea sp. TaxID=2029877 RepID=UPI0032989D5E
MDQAGTPPPRFFGYGSLVNRATHGYQDIQRTRISGWARVWRQTTLHDAPFLTATPEPGSTIEGLTAAVPNADWRALDEREHGYNRIPLTCTENTAIYEVPVGKHPVPPAPHSILMSYLDVVVQGYLREFGEAGAALFFATTHGWDTPILDDRAAPRYPRHQVLNTDETRFVDEAVHALECTIIRD